MNNVSQIVTAVIIASIFGIIAVLISRKKRDSRLLVWFGAGFILGPIGWLLAYLLAKPQAPFDN